MQIKNVCVFAASSPDVSQLYRVQAYRLGQLLAANGIGCVCGAGREGLMRAVSDGELDNGGAVTGVIPRFMVDKGWGYNRLSQTIVTENMHERKQIMADSSDAVIALPGGCGTFEELLEAITWCQLGLFVKPIIILNVNGFYDSLKALLDRACQEHFMKKSHSEIWRFADDADEVIGLLLNDDFVLTPPESKY